MAAHDTGGAAFPRPMGNNGLTNHEEHKASDGQSGMTLRDYFAGQALIDRVVRLRPARTEEERARCA